MFRIAIYVPPSDNGDPFFAIYNISANNVDGTGFKQELICTEVCDSNIIRDSDNLIEFKISSFGNGRYKIWSLWDNNSELFVRYAGLELPNIHNEMVETTKIQDFNEGWVTAFSSCKEPYEIQSFEFHRDTKIDQVYLNHIFFPGRFSIKVISLACQNFINSLPMKIDDMLSQQVERFEIMDISLIHQSVMDIISSSLNIPPNIDEITDDEYQDLVAKSTHDAYKTFLSICVQLKDSENCPFGLNVDNIHDLVFVSKLGGLSVFRSVEQTELFSLLIENIMNEHHITDTDVDENAFSKKSFTYRSQLDVGLFAATTKTMSNSFGNDLLLFSEAFTKLISNIPAYLFGEFLDDLENQWILINEARLFSLRDFIGQMMEKHFYTSAVEVFDVEDSMQLDGEPAAIDPKYRPAFEDFIGELEGLVDLPSMIKTLIASLTNFKYGHAQNHKPTIPATTFIQSLLTYTSGSIISSRFQISKILVILFSALYSIPSSEDDSLSILEADYGLSSFDIESLFQLYSSYNSFSNIFIESSVFNKNVEDEGILEGSTENLLTNLIRHHYPVEIVNKDMRVSLVQQSLNFIEQIGIVDTEDELSMPFVDFLMKMLCYKNSAALFSILQNIPSSTLTGGSGICKHYLDARCFVLLALEHEGDLEYWKNSTESFLKASTLFGERIKIISLFIYI